ncbi:MAG: glycosyltransferase [Candidatus Odinarchaeia archaeon]
MQYDLVINTKNNQQRLFQTLKNIRKHLKYRRLIIVDSSEKPLTGVKKAKIIHTPNAKLGYARQVGLEESKGKYTAYIDDDLFVKEDVFRKLSRYLDYHTIAASPLVIYGRGFLAKMNVKCKNTFAGGGAVILDREAVLSIGGWDKNIHMCEDIELELRCRANGYRWVKSSSVVVYHAGSIYEWLLKSLGYAKAVNQLIKDGYLKKTTVISGLVNSCIEPIYYGIKTFDFRVFSIQSLFKLLYLIGVLRGNN